MYITTTKKEILGQEEILTNIQYWINISINASTDQAMHSLFSWVFDCLTIVCLQTYLPRNVGVLETVRGIPLSGKNCSDVISLPSILSFGKSVMLSLGQTYMILRSTEAWEKNTESESWLCKFLNVCDLGRVTWHLWSSIFLIYEVRLTIALATELFWWFKEILYSHKACAVRKVNGEW